MNVISATWPLGHITPLWLLNLDRGLLTIPLQDRVSQLWWRILFCPQTEWAWGATAGHATANYPSETWRESLSCITHVHTESTDTFNESKKILLAFTLLLNFIWILKENAKSHVASRVDPRVKGACILPQSEIVQIWTFECTDTFYHLICMPTAVMFVWFGICERTRAINEVAGNGTCSFSARFPSICWTVRQTEKMAMIRVTPQDATAHNWKKEFKVSYEITSV